MLLWLPRLDVFAVSLLEPLKDVMQSATDASLELVVKAKGQEDQQLSAMLDSMRAVGNTRVGVLPKEAHTGQLADLWTAKLGDSGLQTVDATPGKRMCGANQDSSGSQTPQCQLQQ